MRIRGLSTWAWLTALALHAACGGGSSNGGTNPNPPGTSGWTVLVYMTADNNLEEAGLVDLTEMASVTNASDVRFVVQADRAAGEYTGGVLNLGDWTSTKRLLVSQGHLQQLADLGEVDMGLSATLADFVNWGVTTYPGDHLMLVFWDHGGGWVGFGWDDSHTVGGGEPDHLSLDRIVTGVSQGLAGTGVSKLDVIGFDACLMATIEVAESLKPYASYLIASEETEPGHGWDWSAFVNGGTLGAEALGRNIIDGYYDQAVAAGDAADVTLSLVDLSKLGPIETALGTVATAYGTAGNVAPVIGQVAAGRFGAAEYGASPDPSQAYSLVDIVDLFSRMGGLTGSAAVQSAVSSAVVYQVAGAAKVGSNGLSIYFPPGAAYYDAGYDTLPGMAAWRTFLAALFAGGAAQTVPTFETGSYDAVIAGLTVTGTITTGAESAVSEAKLGYGVSDLASGAWLLGDSPAVVSGSDVTGTWDWSVLTLEQGTYAEYGYLSVEVVSASLFSASIPLAYDEPGAASLQSALWRIVFDTGGSVVSNNVFLFTGSGVAELSPAAGSKLRAVVMYMADLASWSFSWELSAPAGAGFDATQPFGLNLVTLSSGVPYAAVLRIENAGGEGDWLYVPAGVTVP